jgi:hypothetical protein
VVYVMVKLFGFLFFWTDLFLRKASVVAWDMEQRRQGRNDAKRRAWLLTLNPDEVEASGMLEDVILAQQARAAQAALPMTKGMIRKGGVNRGPSKVITRPPPPGQTRRNAKAQDA